MKENINLLKKMTVKAILKKAEDVAFCNVVSHMEQTYSVDAIVSKSNANYRLFIKKKSASVKRIFNVFDEHDNKKYIIKTDALTFGYPCIRLYDIEKHEIGKVELTSKTGMGSYTLYIDGRELGKLIRKISVKIKFDIDFNGWHLDGNLLQNSFYVTDSNGNIVIKFNDTFSPCNTYLLEMNNRECEIMGLLLVMAVELALKGNN